MKVREGLGRTLSSYREERDLGSLRKAAQG